MFSFDHVSLSVKKLSETINFYKIFGFEVFNQYESEDKSIRIVMLKNNDNEYIELFNYSNYKENPEYMKSLSTDLPVIGTKHMAFRVKDIKKVKEYVEENDISKNVNITSGKLGRKYFFINDPNGILIELIEEK